MTVLWILIATSQIPQTHKLKQLFPVIPRLSSAKWFILGAAHVFINSHWSRSHLKTTHPWVDAKMVPDEVQVMLATAQRTIHGSSLYSARQPCSESFQSCNQELEVFLWPGFKITLHPFSRSIGLELKSVKTQRNSEIMVAIF